MNQKLEVISKAVAEKLEAHVQVIQTLIAAKRRGAAEQFGYAFLAGRALLQAKAIVPNGNSRRPNAGFRNWVAANLPEITLRTAENWMLFAESILSRAQVDVPSSPLLLGAVQIECSAHDSILKLVSEIMDGKGMMRFMRDSRLVLTPKRARKIPGKIVSAAQQRVEKNVRARRFWERVLASIDQAVKILPHIENSQDLIRYSEHLAEAGDHIRKVVRALESKPRG